MFLHYAFVLKGEYVSFVPVAFVLSFFFFLIRFLYFVWAFALVLCHFLESHS